MHAALGLGETTEDGERVLLDARGERAALEERPDVGVRPVRVMVVGVMRVRLIGVLAVDAHVELRRVDTRALHPLGAHFDAVQREHPEGVPQRVQRQPEMEQRADRHVAADAREGIQVSDLHRCLDDCAPCRRMVEASIQRSSP
jgi:hypothetical protein